MSSKNLTINLREKSLLYGLFFYNNYIGSSHFAEKVNAAEQNGPNAQNNLGR